VLVQSEDQPDRMLLETRICKEDGFQKQQDTLIVWTEPTNGVDMALSFQESEGCAAIWSVLELAYSLLEYAIMLTYLVLQEIREQHSAATAGH
jgi:hypothetical protein